jgi:hypothetical protein
MRILAIILLCGAASAGDLAEPSAEGFAWGRETNGLTSRIWAAQHQFKVGVPITVWHAKKNVGKEPMVVWNSGFWPNTRVFVFDHRGNDVTPTEAGRQGIRAFSPGGERKKNVPWVVEPGKEEAHQPVELTRYFQLDRPGLYSVQFLYEEYQEDSKGKKAWRGQCWSNILSFEIR